MKDDAVLGLDGGDLDESGLVAAQAQFVVGDTVDHRVAHGGAAQGSGDPSGDETQVAQPPDEDSADAVIEQPDDASAGSGAEVRQRERGGSGIGEAGGTGGGAVSWNVKGHGVLSSA